MYQMVHTRRSELLNRMFLARILRPIYDEELRRLDDYARAHGPLEH